MTFEVTGQSALGYDMYEVVINPLDTHPQRRDYDHWKKIRRTQLDEAGQRAVAASSDWGQDFKIPIFIQGGDPRKRVRGHRRGHDADRAARDHAIRDRPVVDTSSTTRS